MRWLALAVPALLSLGSGIRTDEVLCENALAHLSSCCPTFRPDEVSCVYTSQGDACNGPYTINYTALLEPESRCILALDCNTIVATGMCAKVQAIVPDEMGGCGDTIVIGTCPSDVDRVHTPVCQ